MRNPEDEQVTDASADKINENLHQIIAFQAGCHPKWDVTVRPIGHIKRNCIGLQSGRRPGVGLRGSLL